MPAEWLIHCGLGPGLHAGEGWSGALSFSECLTHWKSLLKCRFLQTSAIYHHHSPPQILTGKCEVESVLWNTLLYYSEIASSQTSLSFYYTEESVQLSSRKDP
jgi:hypothetical protein